VTGDRTAVLAPPPAPSAPPVRHGGRRAWQVAGVGLAVIVVAWGAWSVASLLGRDVRIERHVVDEQISALEVHASGTIRVVAGTGDRVVVTERIESSLTAPRRSEELVDGRLVLRSSCPPAISTFCSVSYTVEVPPATALLLRSSGGGIRVDGIDGLVDAHSSGGGVRVRGGSGALRLSSSGGGVTVLGGRSTTIDASSSGGGVRLELAVAPDDVSADSSGGGVTVEIPRTDAVYAVDASASGGSTRVEVRTDPLGERRIRARSSGGGVTVRYR
jgi:hypothetical protein